MARILDCRACLLFLVLICLIGVANTTKWKTLNGKEPLVIARGGFSGLFPDSSSKAYEWAHLYSLSNVIHWCDVQLMRDGSGICAPGLLLENSTCIHQKFKSGNKTYSVNGIPTEGWFSADYSFSQLSDVYLLQGLAYRPDIFDRLDLPVLSVDSVANQTSPQGLWLNIKHDMFFTERGLNMAAYIQSLLKRRNVAYISSPELSFLKKIKRFTPKRTKLIISFISENQAELTTNMSYTSLLKDLSFIRQFGSGILVPKEYIFPLGDDKYMKAGSSVVIDAHRAGLEVFAYPFANDEPYAYDFGYDPVQEYLQFIDNGKFSVDGVVSDYPITPSAAIACYSNLPSTPVQDKPTVISSCGSSGLYAGCTNDSYLRAVSDGIDILDCPIQMTKDGIPICFGSINLSNSTDVKKSKFRKMKRLVPELAPVAGVFTFSLTWNQIQTLTPSPSSFCSWGTSLARNPKYAKAGKFLSLVDFLNIASKSNSVSGVLISLEHAMYLMENEDIHLVDSVLELLRNMSQILKKQRVLIQSTEVPVLSKFKENSDYEIILKVEYDLHKAEFLSDEILRNLVDTVVVTKSSVFPQDAYGYITDTTDVVWKLHQRNVSVFVDLFRNEYLSQDYDFMADPYVEINTFVSVTLVDGVITEYPATAAKFKRNRCIGVVEKSPGRAPAYMEPALPGGLLTILNGEKTREEKGSHSGGRLYRLIKEIAFWIGTSLVIIIGIGIISYGLIQFWHNIVENHLMAGVARGQGIQLIRR